MIPNDSIKNVDIKFHTSVSYIFRNKIYIVHCSLFSGGDQDQLTLCRTITQACNKGFVNDIFKDKCFMTRHLLVKFLGCSFRQKKMNKLI